MHVSRLSFKLPHNLCSLRVCWSAGPWVKLCIRYCLWHLWIWFKIIWLPYPYLGWKNVPSAFWLIGAPAWTKTWEKIFTKLALCMLKEKGSDLYVGDTFASSTFDVFVCQKKRIQIVWLMSETSASSSLPYAIAKWSAVSPWYSSPYHHFIITFYHLL